MIKTIMALTLSATVTGLLVIGSAASAETLSVLSERVSYADLNLHSIAGQTTLHRRLRAAAERVCDLNDAITMTERAAATRCVDHAVSKGDMAIADAADPDRNPLELALADR